VGDDRAQVAGQLRQGDQVVALGAHLLRDGARVRVGTPPSPTVAQGAQP
jgi:hypothetical protein